MNMRGAPVGRLFCWSTANAMMIRTSHARPNQCQSLARRGLGSRVQALTPRQLASLCSGPHLNNSQLADRSDCRKRSRIPCRKQCNGKSAARAQRVQAVERQNVQGFHRRDTLADLHHSQSCHLPNAGDNNSPAQRFCAVLITSEREKT